MDARRAVVPTALVLIGVALGGCTTPLGGEGDGSAALYVKDAATDTFASIFVTFTKAEVHRGADNDTEANDTAGWITLVEGEETVDLLQYSEADSRAFLGETNLTAGTYNQIRIEVSEARGVLHDGSEVTFQVSSGTVKLVQGFRIEADRTTRIVLDFDLDRQGVLVEQGNGQWRMTPVVGSVDVEIVDEDAGQSIPDDETGTGDSGNQTNESQSGLLTTYVKDAATDEFSEIWITFDRVEVHFAPGSTDDENETDDGASNETGDDDGNVTNGNMTDGNVTNGNLTNGNMTNGNATGNETGEDLNETSTGDENGGQSPWIVVVNETRSVNLLNFSDEGSKAFLGAEELDPGKYTQIRISLVEAWGITPEGERVDFDVLRADAKVVKPFDVVAGETTQIVIDLDLDRSLVRTGPPDGQGQGPQQGAWKLTPVIGRVIVENDVEDDPMADVPDEMPEIPAEGDGENGTGNETGDGNETGGNETDGNETANNETT